MADDDDILEQEQEEISDDEAIKKLAEAMKGSAMSPEEKQNVFTFLTNVAITKDTTKTAFLRDDKDLNEVGIPKLPVRTYHSLALVASDIMNNVYFEAYFKKEAEIIAKTSLSRGGFLTKLAVMQRREIADVTAPRRRKSSKSWFKSKEPQMVSQYGEPET